MEYPESDKARNGGRRSRSAAGPQSDRWSPKRFAPHLASLRFPFWQSLGSGHIVAGGDSSGPNLWGSSKPPSFQTSKLPIVRPAGGSRPLIGSNRRNRRFPSSSALCSLRFFVPLRVPRSVDTVSERVRRRCRGVGGSWGRRPGRYGGWSGRRRDKAGRNGGRGFARGPLRPCRQP